MSFLKRLGQLFAGGGSTSAGGDVGLYYFVRCKRCGEVIRIRINPMNDLSQRDDEQGLFVHKTIVGQRCYNRIEADFEYSAKRQLVNTQINGGDLVGEDVYEADQVAHPPTSKS